MNHYFKWSFTLCCLLLGMQFSLFNLQAQSSSEELLFITLVGGTPKFVAQTLGSSQTRELANAIFESGAEITSISLSPNRTSIAFSSRKDRGGGYPTETIFVFNLQTGVLRQITSHDSTSAFPVWSPDSSRLAYLTGFGMNGYDGVNIVNLTTL